MHQDIRWKQRFNNYKKAFSQLQLFLSKELNNLEEQGLIKAFEYTYELAWKTLQDLLKEKGYEDIVGPKPVIDQSFLLGFIEDGNGWVSMHKSRNLTSYIYNEDTAQEIADSIRARYAALFKKLIDRLESENQSTQPSLFNND